MSKSRGDRNAESESTSALDPFVLAQYRRAARVLSQREDVRAFLRLLDEYSALVAAGENLCAMGAAIELLDVVMRIATTPALGIAEWAYKSGFFERHFPPMAETIHHPHAARVARRFGSTMPRTVRFFRLEGPRFSGRKTFPRRIPMFVRS